MWFLGRCQHMRYRWIWFCGRYHGMRCNRRGRTRRHPLGKLRFQRCIHQFRRRRGWVLSMHGGRKQGIRCIQIQRARGPIPGPGQVPIVIHVLKSRECASRPRSLPLPKLQSHALGMHIVARCIGGGNCNMGHMGTANAKSHFCFLEALTRTAMGNRANDARENTPVGNANANDADW